MRVTFIVCSNSLAVVHQAADWRRRRRSACRPQADALRLPSGRSRVEPDPTAPAERPRTRRAGREVVIGPDGPSSACTSGFHCDQVSPTRNAPPARGAQDMHQQPAGVAAGPAASWSVSSGVCTPGSSGSGTTSAGAGGSVRRGSRSCAARACRRWPESRSRGVTGSRARYGTVHGRLARRRTGRSPHSSRKKSNGLYTAICANQIDRHPELVRLFRKDQPREVVRKRILLPVDEVQFGSMRSE